MACCRCKSDIRIRRGANAPRAIWKPPISIYGSEWTLEVKWRGGSLSLTTEADQLTTDVPHGYVIWAYSADQAAMLPIGRLTRYQLERRVPGGEKRVYAIGHFIVNRDLLP